MRSYIKTYLFLLFLLPCGVTDSQELPYAREIVNTLASPAFKGRGYVQNGNKKSANYIIQQYKKSGLKAFQNDYRQPFGVSVNTFPGRMMVSIGNKQLVAGKDYLVDPASPSARGSFGLFVISGKELTDSVKLKKAIDAGKGKFLVIDDRGSGSYTHENAARVSEALLYLKTGKNLNLAGIIIHTAGKLTWSISGVRIPHPVIVVGPAVEISENSILSLDIESELGQYTTANVVGYLPGTAVPDSFLVITAHYDHLGKMGKDTYFPGANDNASGVAMMLALARYFSSHPARYTVVFMAFTGEEAGLLGSLYYVNHPFFDLRKIRFLVNFDLAGTGDDGIKVVNGTVFPGQFKLLRDINDGKNLLKSVQVRGPACNSDHCPFYSRGVPCFYIYTLGGIDAYHDIYDKAETLPLTEFNDYFNLMAEFFTKVR
ncbi:MAG TPA: M28 family peptidase [Bacteroidales bacterium]|nr:M28 family peptidase [Bacteroidales bacterium]